MNYRTVRIGQKAVRIVEGLNKNDITGRFVNVLGNQYDDSAAAYILNREFDKVPRYQNRAFVNASTELNSLGYITDTFNIQSPVSLRTIGSGFTMITSREDFGKAVSQVKDLLKVLHLDDEYQVVARYTNVAVVAIIQR